METACRSRGIYLHEQALLEQTTLARFPSIPHSSIGGTIFPGLNQDRRRPFEAALSVTVLHDPSQHMPRWCLDDETRASRVVSQMSLHLRPVRARIQRTC